MLKIVILTTSILAAIFATALRAAAGEPEFRTDFVSVSYHDVVDTNRELSGDEVTADSLVVFFEWVRGNNWHPITLDDIALARDRKKSLPENAVLITFDDGYRSLYTRVYPLVLAYKFPIVAAITGKWMDAPMGEAVPYGEKTNLVPRSNFITWDEAREMQKSGLVEFGSHSYGLHNRDHLSNPQGNRLPPAVSRIYFPETKTYESQSEFSERIRADMLKMNALMTRELGKPPRAMIWPFGRYNMTSLREAQKAGYTFAITLDSGPSSADRPLAIERYILNGDPSLADIVSELHFERIAPLSKRIVSLDPASIYSEDPVEFNNRLGEVIERLIRMGATEVLLDAAILSDDGTITATWFPTKELPVKADILSRIDTQIDRRAGCNVIARLPHLAALSTLKSEERVLSLYNDLGISVVTDGVLIEGAQPPPQLRPIGNRHVAPPNYFWSKRVAREKLDLGTMPPNDQLAWRAFRTVEFKRPRIYAVWLAKPDISIDDVIAAREVADITLLPAEWPHFDEITITRSLALWISGDSPPGEKQLMKAVRDYQIRGGRVMGWTPDDPINDRPNAEAIAPVVSTAWFPPEKYQATK